ncbi:hypothetical protein ACFQV8_17900 [Pseudonocardia benzenivorans]
MSVPAGSARQREERLHDLVEPLAPDVRLFHGRRDAASPRQTRPVSSPARAAPWMSQACTLTSAVRAGSAWAVRQPWW